MLPFGRKTAANIKIELDTLIEGTLATSSSGTSGNVSTLPLFTDAPADLVNRVITSNLQSTSSVISTVGLAGSSVTWLSGIQSRIDETIADIYVDTPNNSPYNYANGTAKSSTLQNNARDKIVQAIFNYDARYYGRRRTNTTYSGENDYFEYPSRHNYLNCPTVLAHLVEHGFGNITSIDDTGTGSTYRITTSYPHGMYDGMSIYSTGTDTGSAATKKYWLANVYSEISSTLDGTDTNSKFYFNANIGTNYLIGANVVVGAGTVGSNGGGFIVQQGSTEWIPLNYQPTRYFKLVEGGTAFEFYYDSALAEKIYPGYGYVTYIQPGYYNETDDSAKSATGGISVYTCSSTGVERTHMLFEDTPQIFNRPTGWTGNCSIYERKTIASVEPWTGLWTVSSGGFSIYDGQLTNFAGMGAVTGWENIQNLTTPLYFKKFSDTTFKLYLDQALTTRWDLGEYTGSLTGIAYSGGTARFTFSNDYINLIDGLPIYTASTGTAFSSTRNVDSISGTNPQTATLDASHAFQNGQPVRLNQNTSQVLYAKTSGLAANEVQLYTSVTWAGSTPSFSTPYLLTVGDDIRPVFFMKRISNTVWECYVDKNLAVGYTVTNSLVGLTTGSIGPSVISSTISYVPSAGYLHPMFFCRMDNYYSASLWVDAARTTPYAYYKENGAAGTAGIVDARQGTTPGTYYINNIGHKYKFTSSSDALAGWMVQVYFIDVISSTTLDLYLDPLYSYKMTNPATAAISGGTFIASYLDQNVNSGRYRLSSLETINMGAETYWYDSNGDGVDDAIDASWYDSGRRYYTAHYATNQVLNTPNLITEEYRSANANAYYGRLRNVVSSGTTTATGAVVQSDTTTYASVGTGPCYFASADPGRFLTDDDILIRLAPNTDATPVIVATDQVALANTAPEWDTVSNMTDRASRTWPSTIQPQSVTWTIDQPNQNFETLNLTRFTRAKEATQYRIRCIYPPMTKAQFKDFHDVILSARGSFKPVKLKLPTSGGSSQTANSMYGRYFDRGADSNVPYVQRFRRLANGGQRLIEIDGAPRNRDQADTSGTGELYVFGRGHAASFADAYDFDEPGYKTSLGGWAVPIHNVESNEYGEINIRVNNGMPGYMPVGTRFIRDAGDLDVFLDGNSVEIKVDTRGFHYLEVEFITKRIF